MINYYYLYFIYYVVFSPSPSLSPYFTLSASPSLSPSVSLSHDMYYKGCGLLCAYKKSFNTAIPARSLGPYMYVHYCTMYMQCAYSSMDLSLSFEFIF